ncbi:MAG: DUF2974 domain-containing protein [Oscillospiraceae bacterium]|nr:DUF2974 domain-containing protein [Oscillospiraceae bacterium]
MADNQTPQLPPEMGGEEQVNTSMLLDTFMYINQCPDDMQGAKMDQVLAAMDTSTMTNEERDAYDLMCDYVEDHPNSQFANLHLNTYSNNLEGYNGAYAASFYTGTPDDPGSVYVSYRGTGDGRWYDNGEGLANTSTPYQRSGCDYFDSVMEGLHVDSNDNVVVTGHSKGGNMAQYALLASNYSYLVDTCISVDGQGFSPEAIAYFKELYGEEEFNARCDRMYSLRGDNDFVNVLGIPVIPEDHRYFVETHTALEDVPGAHEITNMFDYENGHLNELTNDRREMSVFSEAVSENIMKLPQEDREAVCHAVMSLCELGMGRGEKDGEKINLPTGLNGETASWDEYVILFKDLHYLTEEAFTWNGQKLIVKDVHGVLRKLEEDLRDGRGGCVGALLGEVIVLVATVPVTIFVDKVLFVINLASLAFDIGWHIGEILVDFTTFCAGLLERLGEGFRYLFDGAYRAAQNYCASHNIIRAHTQDLRNLAERIRSCNSRLSRLDDRLDNLYWTAHLRDLRALLYATSADMRIAYSHRLNNCATFLDDTAGRLEAAEATVLSLF